MGDGSVKGVCDFDRVMIIAERLRHFSIFTAVNVESKVLINLDSVEAIT